MSNGELISQETATIMQAGQVAMVDRLVKPTDWALPLWGRALIRPRGRTRTPFGILTFQVTIPNASK